MVETKDSRKVHHGLNVKAARTWKNVTQEWLGDKMGLLQCEVSTLEKKEVIEKKVLDEIANLLDVDLSFLETFIPEDVLRTYHIQNDNTNISNTINEGANETIVMGSNSIENQRIDNGVPFNEVKEFFLELRNQDKEILELKLLLAKNGIDYLSKDKE